MGIADKFETMDINPDSINGIIDRINNSTNLDLGNQDIHIDIYTKPDYPGHEDYYVRASIRFLNGESPSVTGTPKISQSNMPLIYIAREDGIYHAYVIVSPEEDYLQPKESIAVKAATNMLNQLFNSKN